MKYHECKVGNVQECTWLTFTTVKPVMRGHLNKCPYMTGVPSSQVKFNVKLHFGS